MKNLMILVAVGLLLVAGTLFFALRYFDGPPVETHYKRGLSYDRNNQRIKKLGLELNIDKVSSKNDSVSLRFTLKKGRDASIEGLKPTIRRPASGDTITPHSSPVTLHHSPFTVHLSFRTAEKGFFLLDVPVLIKGNDQPVFLQKSFYIK